jgi:hypothetical protein
VACEVLVYQVNHDGLIVGMIPLAKPVANEIRGPIELVLLIDVLASE